MRLESTKLAMFFFPLASIAYGWLAEKHAPIATICVALFFAGFFSMCVLLLLLAPHFLCRFLANVHRMFVIYSWIYSSTLAYIVDANNGRSSSAAATNSSFRGLTAFIFAEAAVPLQVRQRLHSIALLQASLYMCTDMKLSISFRTDLPAAHRRVAVLASMSIATPLSTFAVC